MLSVTI